MLHNKKNLLSLLLYAFLALMLLAPLGSNNMVPNGQDMRPHIGAIIQGGKAIEAGQFPLRIAPQEHKGEGYAHFQFYGPSLYTVAGVLRALFPHTSPVAIFKLLMFIAFFMGGFFTYLAAKQYVKNNAAALLSGVIYMTAPYFLINAYGRMGLAEIVATGLLPLVFYTTYQLCRTEKNTYLYVCFSAFAWYFLLTTHLLTFFNSSFFLGLFFLLINRHSLKNLMRVAIAYALACALGAWFIVPILQVSHLFSIDFHGLLDFNWLTMLPRLLSPISLGPEAPNITGWNQWSNAFYPSIGWPILMSAIGCWYAVKTKKIVGDAYAAKVLLGIFLLAFFATWAPVDFWHYLPRAFSMTQFSYRYLTYTMLFGALLGSYALTFLFEEIAHLKLPDWLKVMAGTWLIVMSNASWLTSFYPEAILTHELIRHPAVGYNLEGATDYLIPVDKISALKVSQKITHCQRHATKTVCNIPFDAMGETVQLPVLYYPELLRVTVDNNRVDYFPAVSGKKDNLKAYVGVKMPENAQEICIEFIGSHWANRVSAITAFLLCLVCMIIFYRNSRRKNSE